MELHLSESVDLTELAGIAGLSLYHFARAFKQSAGAASHHYLVQCRIERAQEMLTRSEVPLSEIALAAGSSDQSHLARFFASDAGHNPWAIPLVATLAVLSASRVQHRIGQVATGRSGAHTPPPAAVWITPVMTGPRALLVIIRPEPTHYAREPVTTAILGLNKLAVLAESFAQGEDLNPQIVRADDDVRPDQSEQLVLRNQRSVGLHQDHEDVERACAEFDWLAAGEQPPLAQQYAEAAELKPFVV